MTHNRVFWGVQQMNMQLPNFSLSYTGTSKRSRLATLKLLIVTNFDSIHVCYMVIWMDKNKKSANKHLWLVCWFKKFNIFRQFHDNFLVRTPIAGRLEKKPFPPMLWYHAITLSSSSHLLVGTFKFMYISHIKEVIPHTIMINILAF